MKKYFIVFIALFALSVFGFSKYVFVEDTKTTFEVSCVGSSCIDLNIYDKETKFYLFSTIQSNNCERIFDQAEKNLDNKEIYNYFSASYEKCLADQKYEPNFLQRDIVNTQTIPFDIKKYIFGKMNIDDLEFVYPKQKA